MIYDDSEYPSSSTLDDGRGHVAAAAPAAARMSKGDSGGAAMGLSRSGADVTSDADGTGVRVSIKNVDGDRDIGARTIGADGSADIVLVVVDVVMDEEEEDAEEDDSVAAEDEDAGVEEEVTPTDVEAALLLEDDDEADAVEDDAAVASL